MWLLSVAWLVFAIPNGSRRQDRSDPPALVVPHPARSVVELSPVSPDERPHRPEPTDDASAWERLRRLPDLDDAPLDEDWATGARRVGPSDGPPVAPPADGDARSVDQRRFRVAAAGAVGAAPAAPPSRPGPTPAPGAPVGPAPAPIPLPGEAPAGVPPRRTDTEAPARTRRRGPWIATAIAVPVLALLAMFVYALVQWNRIERVDTAGALAAGGDFTNYLIVGTDSREGVDPDLATAPSIGLGVEGSRTDTMVVLHIGDDGNRMMSLPRDLWLPIDGGNAAKLNSATVVGGAPALIRTVQRELGIPLQRYLEVDIAGFLEVVEAVGSITIEFPRPACDPRSGLMVRQRGAIDLGPQRALAYVRSRTYTEFSAPEVRRVLGPGATCDQIIAAGLGSTDGTADIGRGDRQRRFLLAVFDEIGGTRNPVTLLQVLGGLSGGLRIDDEMGMFDALSLARKMRGGGIESVELPVVAFDPGGTSALLPADDAGEVIDGFR